MPPSRRQEDQMRNICSKYLPGAALDYCVSLWQKHPFSFKVTRERQTKLGDYRFDSQHQSHTVTVNGSLNIYAFTITFIHEVAHQHTFIYHGRNQQPHGKVWKKMFQTLMLPLLNEEVFPQDILAPLKLHMRNPKASSSSDPRLVKALRSHDPENDKNFLNELQDGDNFVFNGNIFKKLTKRRTRVLCEENHSRKKYLISGAALVQKLDV